MSDYRPAQLDDLAVIASWIRSQAECRQWSGLSLSYPIDVEALPGILRFDVHDCWTRTAAAASGGPVVAFGQLMTRSDGRRHLARLISSPDHRGEGFGRGITTFLFERALEQGAKVISLNVLAVNTPAVNLYRSLGFRPAERPEGEPDLLAGTDEFPTLEISYMEFRARESAS